MPISSSYASASKRGFSAPGSSGSSPGSTSYYFNALNTKGNNNPPSGAYGNNKIKTINNTTYQFGTGSSSGSTVLYRPYVIATDATGTMTTYKLWEVNYYRCKGFVIDSSGNQHVLFTYDTGFLSTAKFRLLKFDSSDNLVYAKEFTFPTGNSPSRATFDMVIDSNDNLYIGTVYLSYFAITKVDCATYTVQWSNYIGGGAGINWITDKGKLVIDSSNNVTMAVKYYAGSPTAFDFLALYSVTSAGVWRWDHAYVNTYASGTTDITIDSSGNTYSLFGNAILKHTSAGSLIYTKLMTTPAGGTSDAYYSGISYNNAGSVMLLIGSSTGLNIIATPNTGGNSTTNTAYALANGWDPNTIYSDSNNTYVLCEYNNGTGAVTPSAIKVKPGGTPLAGSNTINFSETLDNGTTNSWSGTISTTAVSNVTASNVSYSVASGSSLTPITITVANITQALGATMPVVYTTPLT